MMNRTFLPGSIIGIVGGGQLGRMTAQAARTLGYKVAVLDPNEQSAAGVLADTNITASFDDPEAYRQLADQSDVVTYEFENVSAKHLDEVQRRVGVVPDPHALRITQNRLREKETLRSLQIPTADFVPVNNANDLQTGIRAFGHGVLKTVSGGYDGKGQAVLTAEDDVRATYNEVSHNGKLPLILERFVPFVRELSVIVARNARGEVQTFPVAENIHRNGILHLSIAPARISQRVADEAEQLAAQIANGLKLIGVMGIELFQTDNGLCVNELAPRPHNSGHYTLDACYTSQFEQHVRAVAGLPLGSTAQHTPAAMLNILGEHMPHILHHMDHLVRHPHIKLHLYDKGEARKGRKMGHITAVCDDVGTALEQLKTVWMYFGTKERLL